MRLRPFHTPSIESGTPFYMPTLLRKTTSLFGGSFQEILKEPFKNLNDSLPSLFCTSAREICALLHLHFIPFHILRNLPLWSFRPWQGSYQVIFWKTRQTVRHWSMRDWVELYFGELTWRTKSVTRRSKSLVIYKYDFIVDSELL